MSDSVENLLFNGKKGYLMKLFDPKFSEFLRCVAICQRCERIMRDPCKILQGGPQDTVCLNCKKDGEEVTELKAIQRGILILRVKCALQERGCKWTGKLTEIRDHLGNCEEFLLECPQKCKEIRKRSDLEVHMKNHCAMRIVECEHCTRKFHFKDMATHLNTCEYFPVECICGERPRRKDLRIHQRDICLETVIECHFKEYKCEEKFKRRFLEEHLKKNEVKHITLKVVALETRIQILEGKNNKLTAEARQLAISKIDYEEQNKKLKTEVDRLEARNIGIEKMNNNLNKKVYILDELSRYTFVLDWIIVVNIGKMPDINGPTFILPDSGIKVYTKYRIQEYANDILSLSIAVWPISMKEAFSYNYWSFIVDQHDQLSTLCNYKCTDNREMITGTASKVFESCKTIAKFPRNEIDNLKLKQNGKLHVRIYVKR
ncbi:TNF receptor-associated factor 6-A-like [Oopsacas minuta]|uniref:TNF receptor-associated factor 6-A-like n=1 Tax=Oopsacas minuta TaxID=111878 RepID=A0AAV7KA34_9METZ|nr:TNF receptor-associated factor 6-A-like [Oopsacas minuta]